MSRYDAKARDLFRSLVMDEARSVPMIAAALEAEYAEGWNAAVAEDEGDAPFPAAAPAAETVDHFVVVEETSKTVHITKAGIIAGWQVVRGGDAAAKEPSATPTEEPDVCVGSEYIGGYLVPKYAPSEPAAPAAETCSRCGGDVDHGRGCSDTAPPSEPVAPAGYAQPPDPEGDRNRHNAMLVEAWREEFSTLCKVLFPGNDGPIGWKHVQAKVAALAKAKEPPT